MEEGGGGNTGSPVGGGHAPTGTPRGAGRAGRVAERPAIPRKPGNAGGGKGPQVRRDAGRTKACGSGSAQDPALMAESPERVTCRSEGVELDLFDVVEA